MMAIVLLGVLIGQPVGGPISAKVIRVEKIWDHDAHSAFTDLIRWQGHFVCCFRVGKKHVSPDGAIQLLYSSDGREWKPLGKIESKIADLRDPKLIIGTKNELMVLAAGALHDKKEMSHQTFLWSSTDGKTWGQPAPVGEPDCWLWRVIPNQGRFFGWGYGTGKERFVRLYGTDQVGGFVPVTDRVLQDRGYPNETGMVMQDGRAWCLLRRDGQGSEANALWGTASIPFREWTWTDMGVKIGGPSLIRLSSGEFLATVRLYSPAVKTSLCWVDEKKRGLHELVALPSGGDCSYAGMVWHQEQLWISYYSSHEGKSSIYLAQVQIQKR